MAEWNADHYCEKEVYSDGSVEDVIEDIVKRGLDYHLFSDCNDYYAILYHLSAERENILNWYPFVKSDRILEAGSGCGAITGLLCQKAGWVTSIELSKKRASINYLRHKHCENLEIVVGNLHAVKLKQQYDYVVLNGVLEYAGSYGCTQSPYRSFLNSVKEYLKPNGKILLAIENRLGLKYFAGAPEDHTDLYYAGIREYAGINGIRTFSKGELEDLFKECRFANWKFYYPYPDYKFPSEIFTDANINGENYGRAYRNYQNGRMELFSEKEMAAALKQENAMGSFANSFLVELTKQETPCSRILYAKLNHTVRKKVYRTATIIQSEKNGTAVEKTAIHKDAAIHMKRIYENQNKNLPNGFRYLQGTWEHEKIRYPYLEEKNLDRYFFEWMQQRNIGDIKKHLDRIAQLLMHKSVLIQDFIGKEFKTCFGTAQWNEPMACIEEANVDLILDNLFWIDGEYVVIDAEWVFDFWVPVRFILWRMLNEWYAKHGIAAKIFPPGQMYAAYGITPKMEQVFRSWAVHFAEVFAADPNKNDGIKQPLAVDLNTVLQKQRKNNVIESALYIDYGQGFSEENKQVNKTELQQGLFSVSFCLDGNTKIDGLRWDPSEGCFCACQVESCLADGNITDIKPLNCMETDPSFFYHLDPQFGIEIEPGFYHEIVLAGKYRRLQMREIAHMIVGIEENCVKLQTEQDAFQTQITMLRTEKNAIEAEQIRLETDKNNLCRQKHLLAAELETVRTRCQELEEQKQDIQDKLQCARMELELIKNSRGWKFLGFVRKLLRR